MRVAAATVPCVLCGATCYSLVNFYEKHYFGSGSKYFQHIDSHRANERGEDIEPPPVCCAVLPTT